ncbi:hypothetical protein IAT38_005817 [Cryptococcus sp. DSM 104549]
MPPIPITFHFPAAHGSPARGRYASGVPLISVDKPRAVPSSATTSSRLIHPHHPHHPRATQQLPSPPLSASPARSTSGGPSSPVLLAGATSVASASAPSSVLPSGQAIHHPARSARSSSTTTTALTTLTGATATSASARRKAGVKAQQQLPPGRACITLVPQNGAMAARCAAYAATISGGAGGSGSAGAVAVATTAGTAVVSGSAAATAATSTPAPAAWQAPYHPRTDWSNPRAPLPSIRELHRATLGLRGKNKGGRKSPKGIRDRKEKERRVREVVREMVVRARGGVYVPEGEGEQVEGMEGIEGGAGAVVEGAAPETVATQTQAQGKRKGKKAAKGKGTSPPKNISASPPAGVRSSARLPTPASLPPAEPTTIVTTATVGDANPATPSTRLTRRAKTLSPHGKPLGLPFPTAPVEEPKADVREAKEAKEAKEAEVGAGGRRTRRNSGQPGRLRDYDVVKS